MRHQGGPFGEHLDLDQLLAWVTASDVTYLKLRVGETEFVYTKSPEEALPDRGRVAQEEVASEPNPGVSEADPPVARAPQSAEEAGGGPGAGTGGSLARHSDPVVVRAPMVGLFHRAPMPGAPPYVAPGDRVTASSTVGLIESMKIFTAVTAGVSGTVVAVVAANGQAVERGDPLVTVEGEEER